MVNTLNSELLIDGKTHLNERDKQRFTVITVVHRPPDIAPQNTENESRIDTGAFTQGNLSTYFSINTLSISLT